MRMRIIQHHEEDDNGVMMVWYGIVRYAMMRIMMIVFIFAKLCMYACMYVGHLSPAVVYAVSGRKLEIRGLEVVVGKDLHQHRPYRRTYTGHKCVM